MPRKETPAGKAIGDRLKRIQEEKGYTSKEMADELGISLNSYYSYRNGSVLLGTEICLRYIEVFHVNPNYLLRGDSSRGYFLATSQYERAHFLQQIRADLDHVEELSKHLSDKEKKEGIKYLFLTGAKISE